MDDSLFQAANAALCGPRLSPLFYAISFFGDGLVLAALIYPLAFFFDPARLRRHGLALLIAVAASGLCVNVLKVAVARPRPAAHFAGIEEIRVPYGTPSDLSFPSGHTGTAFGTAVYLGCVYPHAAPFLVAGAALVGVSRIALGVHFPLDVAVGAALGAFFSLAVYWFLRRHRARRRGVTSAHSTTSGAQVETPAPTMLRPVSGITSCTLPE